MLRDASDILLSRVFLFHVLYFRYTCLMRWPLVHDTRIPPFLRFHDTPCVHNTVNNASLVPLFPTVLPLHSAFAGG